MKRKLKNKQGASLVLSLLHLLVCSVISIVIITCSSVLSGTKAGETGSKSYYLTTSLLKCVSEEFSRSVVTVNKNEGPEDLAVYLANNGFDIFGSVFSAAIFDHISENSDSEKTYALEVRLNDTGYVFSGDFILENDYCITVRISSVLGPDGEYALAYVNAVTFKPLVTYEFDDEVIIEYGEGDYYAEK